MDRRTVFSRLSSEEGQIWSWVLKIFLVALVIGAIITQCGPVIWNHISTRSTAKDAADLASNIYQNHGGNMTRVNDEVQKFLKERDARLAGTITVDYDELGKASAISVPVRKIVNTFVFKNIGYLSPYTEAYALGQGNIY